ncbi:amino acid adenylation domain-containing protein [Streptacidiphilus sp. PB12-B1b]|uniref:amino acid adenylation domain-containing protein n=1 Tax=Streptacidiphilus sp. PB12-B1b TaxID=2705012 RepID=UPI0021027D68|nr:amino acid adenylation domain-containing protein [Streptacidiphilus sp. PB12-B1b]
MHPDRTSYNEPKAIRLTGPLDVEALRASLQRVVDRHPALRSVVGGADGEPRMLVRDRVRLDCPLLDRSADTEEAALRELVDTVGSRPFDLAEGPLLRARLVRLADEHHVLFLTAHHIVFDSLSTLILTQDLAAFYRAWPELPTGLPVLPEPDRSAFEAVDPQQHAADLRYWRERLAGAAELELPTDRPRPASGAVQGACLTHDMPAATAARLVRFARDQRATAFSTLLGAIGVALRRLSGQDDLVVGTGLTHRPEGSEQAVGMFVDTVPLRMDLSGDPGFGALVRRLTASSMDAYEHRLVPFDELVRELNPDREAGRNPLFQIAVEYESATGLTFAPGLGVALVDLPSRRAPVDVTLYLTHHADGVRWVVEYDAGLFDEATIVRLLDYAEQVLDRALADPDVRLSELTALTASDRELLSRWQGGSAEPEPEADAPECLHELISRAAESAPDAVALVHRTTELTYSQLNAAADRTARLLLARGVGRGDLVAVCLPRGTELITALLGVLKAGAGYLPLDPSAPSARLEFILADSGVPLLLTARAVVDTVPLPAGLAVLHMDDLHADDPHAGAPQPDEAPSAGPVGPDDLAYCIYTSGSTGFPKPVAVPHRGPVNLVRWDLRQHPPQNTLQWFSQAFDGSVMEIFTTLASGARLVLIDDKLRYDPGAVAEVVRQHRVERLFMPFTPLKYLMESGPSLPSLRTLVSAGETTGSSVALREFLAAHPDCAFFNMYGPTEGSVASTAYRVGSDDLAPPIGRPIDGVEIRLLGADGRPVPVGAVGEIHLAGVSVADGYRGRPAETEKAFPADPHAPASRLYRTGDLARWRADGNLEFRGRNDDQVKIRGHRVELGEVQRTLALMDGVRDAAVVVRPDGDGEAQLVGYLVLDDPADSGALDRVIRQAAARMPGYLVPQQWVQLKALPLNPSGKLDRGRLPAPAAQPRAATAPAAPLEASLHAIWCASLGRSEVDVTQSFFALGGHSLKVVRLLGQVRRELGVEMSLADFFLRPTIRGMAETVPPGEEPTAEPTADGQPVDVAPCTSAQRRMWRRHQAHGMPAVHNMCVRVDLVGALDVEALRAAFTAVAARHSALRTRIVQRDGSLVQEVLAPFEAALPVSPLGPDPSQIQDWCEAQAGEPFALDRAPLFRLRLGRIDEEHWTLCLVMHHIVGDGWSLELLWQEISRSYASALSGQEAPPQAPVAQATDYARWEQRELTGDRRAELERFWRTELADAPLAPALPYDRPRPPRLSGRGGLHRFTLPAALTGRLRSLAAATGSTLPVVLAAAAGLWLSGLAGQEEVVLALSSAKRSLPAHEGIIGYLGEAVPVRISTGAATDFPDLVRRTGTRLFTALDRESLPLTEAFALVDPAYGEMCSPAVMFTVITNEGSGPVLPGLTARVSPLPVPGAARTELYLVFAPDDEVVDAAFEYSSDLLDAETVTRWSEQFTALLAGLTEAPGTPLRG